MVKLREGLLFGLSALSMCILQVKAGWPSIKGQTCAPVYNDQDRERFAAGDIQ